jgi:hypothetical protein
MGGSGRGRLSHVSGQRRPVAWAGLPGRRRRQHVVSEVLWGGVDAVDGVWIDSVAGLSVDVFSRMCLSRFAATVLDFTGLDLGEERTLLMVTRREWALFSSGRACPRCLGESGGCGNCGGGWESRRSAQCTGVCWWTAVPDAHCRSAVGAAPRAAVCPGDDGRGRCCVATADLT